VPFLDFMLLDFYVRFLRIRVFFNTDFYEVPFFDSMVGRYESFLVTTMNDGMTI